MGRNLEVPRAVFARDIARGYSDEPPNGKFWDAKVTEFDSQYAGKFTITLVDVIEVDEDTGEEKLEDFPCSLAQLKKWITEDSLLPHEARATLGQFIIPAAAGGRTPGTNAKGARSKNIFATPGEDGVRYLLSYACHYPIITLSMFKVCG